MEKTDSGEENNEQVVVGEEGKHKEIFGKANLFSRREEKMTYLWCSSTWIFCFVLVPSTISDSDTFSRFCKHPGQFGKGTLECSFNPIEDYSREELVDYGQ
ncbi:hypothetical protein Y032_0894g2916 [Ancylostoma ceylanicum]|uniref:Uncharacterized protein n=1 Tax=Ancylostoma ceylanicum TaxID=53326 RepID=A0A016WA10_9BILA|nr:hypothetical protein Y032_0894g2916 [Ancylostoma ceylanicum]